MAKTKTTNTQDINDPNETHKQQAAKMFVWVMMLVIALVAVVVMWRDIVRVVSLKSDISELEDDARLYRGMIAKDSLIIEQLKFDDYLERYAREKFKLKRADEVVFIPRSR